MHIDKSISQSLKGAADSVVYGRYSSDHQRPTSIADQAEEVCRFAEQRRLPIPGRLVKDEGISVKDGMAPGFGDLLDDVRAGLIRTIFVDELSRISRKTEDVLRVQSVCRYYDVSLWSVHENIDIKSEDSDIHVLFAGHKNQAASRDARHRVKRSMDGNIRRGLSNGDLTLGYTSVELSDDEVAQLGLTPRATHHRSYKRIVIDPDGAKTVRLIFRLFVTEKMTIRAIAGRLQEKQVPRVGKARSSRWKPITVRKVLSNRRYLGFRTRNVTMLVTNPDTGKKTSRRQPENERVEQFDENLAIIDRSIFAAAQNRLDEYRKTYAKRKKRGAKKPGSLMRYAPRQLLSGTLECGNYSAQFVQKYNGRVAYYVCPDAQDKLCDNAVQVNRDLVHQYVLESIREEVGPVYIADRIHELVLSNLEKRDESSAGKLEDLQRKRAKIINEIDNLTAALAKRPQSDSLYEALDDREACRQQLEVEIRDAETCADSSCSLPSADWVQRQLDYGLERLFGDDVTRAAILLRAITGPIWVYPGQKPWLRIRYPIIRFNLDFAQMATTAARENGKWSGEVVDGGFGVGLEFEIRKIPFYEAYAIEVVRLHDEESLKWTEIARKLPVKTSPEYVAMAYRFGKTGDPYGHRAAADGGIPAPIRRTKAGLR